jgi:peptidoglycan hydrolase-like protein with peptidoglycan-binding domain
MGPNTRAAIMKFQADKNLPQTGALDAPTLNALNAPR